MLSQKDVKIVSHLRKNARHKVTHISKYADIPVTTIYDKIRSFEKRFIDKYVVLLNFAKLGLHTKTNFIIRCKKSERERLGKFLLIHPNINSLSKINQGDDFMAEGVFKNMKDSHQFELDLEREFEIDKLYPINIIEELKKEEFLTREEHYKDLD